MNGLARGCWMRWMAGAFLTLLAFVVASSGQARAGCSHDVPTTAHFEHLVHLGAMPEAENPSPEQKNRPCTGPMCSKLPAAPSGPTTLAFAFEPWLWLAAGPKVVPPQFSLLPLDFGGVFPKSAPVSIFHPPRSSSC